MIFDLENFVTVGKKRNHHTTNSKAISISATNMTLGSEATASLFEPNADKASVVIQYNDKAKALRLTKSSDKNAIPFRINKSTSTATGNVTSAFKSHRIPRGTYMLAKGHSDIFVLEEEAAITPKDRRNYYFVESENVKIESGDIVSWNCDPKGHSSFIASGQVLTIIEKENKGVFEDWAVVKPVSKNWLDTFSGRKSTKVKCSNLIIREKYNAN